MVNQGFLVTVKHMVQYGPSTMYQDMYFGHQFQNVCAIVPVCQEVTDAVPLAVKHAVSTALYGDTVDTSAFH